MIMQQILANPELYPPPDGFPSELTLNETEPEPTFWDMEEDNDEPFTIGRHLHLGMFLERPSELGNSGAFG